MGSGVVRLVVEIRTGSDPMRGRVLRDGDEGASFTGWTELGQAIVRLTDDTTPHLVDDQGELR
jgi:hypothetical protein